MHAHYFALINLNSKTFLFCAKASFSLLLNLVAFQDAFILDGVCFMCQTSLMDGEPGGKSSLPPKTAPGAKRRRLSTRNSPPKGSRIVSSYQDLESLQAQKVDQNIFNVMVDVVPQLNEFKSSHTSPSEEMAQEWSLNTPEMEEHVDSPEACEAVLSRIVKLDQILICIYRF